MVSIVACVCSKTECLTAKWCWSTICSALLISHPSIRVWQNLGHTFVAVRSLQMSKPQVSFEFDTLLSIIGLGPESSHPRCAGEVSEPQTWRAPYLFGNMTRTTSVRATQLNLFGLVLNKRYFRICYHTRLRSSAGHTRHTRHTR